MIKNKKAKKEAVVKIDGPEGNSLNKSVDVAVKEIQQKIGNTLGEKMQLIVL